MIQLTDEQAKARDTIVSFLLDSSSEHNAIVLQGSAGTGKSTIINEVCIAYKEQVNLLNTLEADSVRTLPWIFTATTNKAVDSLRKATGLIDVQTIQSLLGLVPRNGGLLATSRTREHRYCIIVIDEASYVDYSLLQYIKKYLSKSKIIYMGDPTQLPPVGLNHAPVFTQDYPTILLTKSMRQINSPDIADFCKQLRDYIDTGIKFPSLSLSQQIKLLDKDKFDEVIHKMNPDTSKILASKNTSVNKYNSTLFKAKYKRNTFDKGDRVINNRYVKDISTDEIITIVDTPVRFNQFGVDGYRYMVKSRKGVIPVFMPDKVSMINKISKQLAETKQWNSLNDVQETWVDLRPHYACTIHKSQGSTFDEVYIDLNDFKSERDLKQLARLLYVAISRAKNKVYLTGDIR